MPIYEYQCEACGTVTDLKHAFREEPPTTTCPACGASPLKRLFNAAGIVFKGSGFYVTDSRSKSGDGTKSGGSKRDGAAKEPAAKETVKSESSGSDAAASSSSETKSPTPPKSDAAA